MTQHPTPLTDEFWDRLAARAAADPVAAVREDQAARWAAGHGVPVEEYLARVPGITDEDALVLIMAEVGLRRDRGATPTPAEYRARFPRLADDLAVQFELGAQLDGLGDATRSRVAGAPGASTLGAPSDLATGNGPPAVPGYEVGEELGRGGMGVVYRATDASLHRDVAVKLLQDRYPTRGPAAARFFEEARITGQLQHPGVPPVHHLGRLADGRPFLVMKLIKGRTLDALLADPATDRARLVAVFEHLCQAVGYAHARGVIHRDLKPQNVMVGAFGEVQVMDWGLAKVLTAATGVPPAAAPDAPPAGTEIRSPRDPDGSHTQAGSVLGTPAYMAPEQAAGETDAVGRRSDVFGLGAVLCTVLTGRPPYVGRDADAVRLMAIRGQLDDAAARLTECGADPDLVALCRRCLAAAPADRPADAGEVAQAVEGFRVRAEARARQAELDRAAAALRAVERRKRRRVQAALGATALALVGLAGFGMWWDAAVRADRADADRRTEADRAREREDARRRTAGVAADGAVRLAYQLLDKWWIDEADATLASAEAAVGGDAPPEVLDRLRAARRDAAFVARLDAVRTTFNLRGDGGQVIDFRSYAAKELPAAFREFGFDLRSGASADIVRRLTASPVRKHALAALDSWWVSEPDLLTRGLVWGYATAVGAEPWRLRLASEWGTAAAVRRVLDAAAPDDRTPALYDFVGGRLQALSGAGLPVYQAGIAQHPADPWLRWKAGNLHFALGQYGPAAAEFRTLTALRPGCVAAWGALAASHYYDNNPAAARAAADKAVGLDDRNWNAHLVRSMAAGRLGDREAARAAARRAVALAPANPRPLIQLGRSEYYAREFAAAADAFAAAAAVQPAAVAANVDYGLTLFAAGRWAESESVFRALNAAGRPVPADLYHEGLLRRRRGDAEGAAALFRRANGDRDVALDDADILYANAVLASWDPALLIDVWGAACRHAPDDPVLLVSLAMLNVYARRYPAGVAAFKRADALGRRQPGWPYRTAEWVAVYAVFACDYETTVAYGREVLANSDGRPLSLNAQYYTGLGFWATGDWAAAERQFRVAIASSPSLLYINYDLAFALRRRGDEADARAAFRRAAGRAEVPPADEDRLYAEECERLSPWNLPIAVDRAEHAARTAPDDPHLQLTLGALYRRAGRHPEAAAAFARAEDLGRGRRPDWPYPTARWAAEERAVSPRAAGP